MRERLPRFDAGLTRMWLIDGKVRSAELRKQIARDVETFTRRYGRKPALAMILVGDNPASQLYVRNKETAACAVGLMAQDVKLPSDTSREALLEVIDRLNADPTIDGILLQLPLPAHLRPDDFLAEIRVEKDVDGLHPFSQGLVMRGKAPLEPCTPKGIVDLIQTAFKDLGRTLAGSHCVVVGRSVLVGRPVAQMLLNLNCTVTQCHSHTVDLKSVSQTADVLIVATGHSKLITKDFVRPGAVVVDVGINRQADGTLCGDVDFEGVKAIAGAITPVPGGVGPMTITMLLQNTLLAAEHREAAKLLEQ